MKKQLFSLALLLGLSSAFVGSSFAADQDRADDRRQRQERSQDHDKRHDRRGQFSAQDRQRRSDELAKELGLSNKQKSKVEKIFQDQQQQMQALRSRPGQDRSRQMSEFQRIHASTDKKLKDVLSKKQYAQLAAKRQERLRQLDSRQGNRPGFDGRRGGFNGRS